MRPLHHLLQPCTVSYCGVARYASARHSCVIKYSTYQYVPGCTHMYLVVPVCTRTYCFTPKLPVWQVHTSTFQYTYVCTRTYRHIPVHTSTYQYIPGFQKGANRSWTRNPLHQLAARGTKGRARLGWPFFGREIFILKTMMIREVTTVLNDRTHLKMVIRSVPVPVSWILGRTECPGLTALHSTKQL